jgi:hypothetical protein
MNEAKMYEQLAYIKRRLETFPYSTHESRVIGECLSFLVRTIAGEEVDIGIDNTGKTPTLINGQAVAVDANYRCRGGVQIAEGVIQYPAPGDGEQIRNQPGGIQTQLTGGVGAPIDVKAGLTAFHGGTQPSHSPAPEVKPVPGSLMDTAMKSMTPPSPPPPEISDDAVFDAMKRLLGADESDESDNTEPEPDKAA